MKKGNLLSSSVEKAVGLLATVLIASAVLIYAREEPQRIERAQAEQLNDSLEQAMDLYAHSCAVCHGASGDGIGANPPLDSAALRESDPASLFKIVSRGLYGTAMPAWNVEDGGPLGDHQIEQIVDLLRFGDWDATAVRTADLGLTPLVPFSSEPDSGVLEALSAIPDGEQLGRGLEIYGESCIACHGVDGLGTALAPALNDPLVRAKSPDEVERTILNGVPGTLMAGWDKILSDEDVGDLLALVARWEEVPSGAMPAPQEPLVVTEEMLAQGGELYAANCSSCHAPEGQGSQRAPALNVKEFLETTPDQAIVQIVTLGVPDTSMPAWGDRMSETQIEALVGFIRAWEPDAPEVATPIRIRGPWSSGSSGAPSLPSGGVNSSGTGKGNGSGYQGGRNQNSAAGPIGQEAGTAVLPEGNAAAPAEPGLNSQSGQQINPQQGRRQGQNQPATAAAPDSKTDGGMLIELLYWWENLDMRAALVGGLVIAAGLLLVLAGFLGYARTLKPVPETKTDKDSKGTAV